MSYGEFRTFELVSRVNLERTKEWHPAGLEDWTPLEWAGAMCGEAGEAANAAKKLKRAETGLQQANGMTVNDARAALAQEIGDTYLYLDLLAQRCDIDMWEAIRDTFNRVSEREGFPQRMPY